MQVANRNDPRSKSPNAQILPILLAAACGHPRDDERANTPKADLPCRLEALTRALLIREHVAGITVAVEQGGRILYIAAFDNPAITPKLAPGTPMRIGSVTKPFTAVAILKLVDLGMARLSDPVGKFVRNLPKEISNVTLNQLLRHTSGITDYVDQLEETPGLERTELSRERIRQLEASGVQFMAITQGIDIRPVAIRCPDWCSRSSRHRRIRARSHIGRGNLKRGAVLRPSSSRKRASRPCARSWSPPCS